MKNLYCIVVLFIFCSNEVVGQGISPKEEEAVKQLVKDTFDEVWSDLDAEKLQKYHTEDFLLLEHGLLWNNDTIANYQARALQENKEVIRNNAFDFVRVEKLGNIIWLAYHNYATWTIHGETVGQAHWLESAIAVPTEEGWKLKMLHSTRVENEEE